MGKNPYSDCPKSWKVLRMGKRLTKAEKTKAANYSGVEPLVVVAQRK